MRKDCLLGIGRGAATSLLLVNASGLLHAGALLHKFRNFVLLCLMNSKVK
jgi:hypothetical protein